MMPTTRPRPRISLCQIFNGRATLDLLVRVRPTPQDGTNAAAESTRSARRKGEQLPLFSREPEASACFEDALACGSRLNGEGGLVGAVGGQPRLQPIERRRQQLQR